MLQRNAVHTLRSHWTAAGPQSPDSRVRKEGLRELGDDDRLKGIADDAGLDISWVALRRCVGAKEGKGQWKGEDIREEKKWSWAKTVLSLLAHRVGIFNAGTIRRVRES